MVSTDISIIEQIDKITVGTNLKISSIWWIPRRLRKSTCWEIGWRITWSLPQECVNRIRTLGIKLSSFGKPATESSLYSMATMCQRLQMSKAIRPTITMTGCRVSTLPLYTMGFLDMYVLMLKYWSFDFSSELPEKCISPCHPCLLTLINSLSKFLYRVIETVAGSWRSAMNIEFKLCCWVK